MMRNGRQVQRFDLAAPAPPPRQQGLGATTANSNPTPPTTVGVVAALGSVAGGLVGVWLGTEIGDVYGERATRRAAIAGFVGTMVGAFAGAALVAPSTQAQGGA